jgi:O-6-methylguanine DNA methyltransferase
VTADSRSTFAARVLTVVRSIPAGRVATYGDVARLAGRPRAARAVGNIMRGCGDPSVPCHRVVGAAGRLGGYGGHEAFKAHLLAAEGLVVTGLRIRGFARARWTGRTMPSKPDAANARRGALVSSPRAAGRSPRDRDRPEGNARARGPRLR